jgi:HEAT repeat protein
MNDEARGQLERLKTAGDDVKLHTLESLSQPVHQAIVEEVRELALSPGDETVRVAAIGALADVRGADAAEVFAQIVRAPGPLPVRAEAALALSSLEGAIVRELVGRLAEEVAGDVSMASLFTTFTRPGTASRA